MKEKIDNLNTKFYVLKEFVKNSLGIKSDE